MATTETESPQVAVAVAAEFARRQKSKGTMRFQGMLPHADDVRVTAQVEEPFLPDSVEVVYGQYADVSPGAQFAGTMQLGADMDADSAVLALANGAMRRAAMEHYKRPYGRAVVGISVTDRAVCCALRIEA